MIFSLNFVQILVHTYQIQVSSTIAQTLVWTINDGWHWQGDDCNIRRYWWLLLDNLIQHTNLPMHVTCPVIMIQQFMLRDLSWTFYFTIYDSRLLRDFLISCLLTYTGITCLCVPMLSTPFSMYIFWFRFIDIHVLSWFQIHY